MTGPEIALRPCPFCGKAPIMDEHAPVTASFRPILQGKCTMTGAPDTADTIPEITPEMIEAGAEALLDGSEITQVMSLPTARYFAGRVLEAALGSTLRKNLQIEPQAF